MPAAAKRERRSAEALLADVELLNDLDVALGRFVLQIVQQTPTSTHHSQEASAASNVFLVLAQMLRQRVHTLGENRDLNFGRPAIVVAAFVLPNDFLLLLFCNRHLF